MDVKRPPAPGATAKPVRPAGPRIVEARRVEGADLEEDGFTYTVLIDPPPAAVPSGVAGDRRDAPRRRTRLRSGKIIDARGHFVTECLVHDLSVTGVRLRLPDGVSLPALFQVYDDQSGQLQEGRVSWQRNGEAGIQFVATADTPRNRIIAADMRRKYYKLPR